MLRKFFSDKINGTENALFFVSQDQTYHSFTLNLRSLYETKRKFVSFKLCMGFSFFDSVSILLKFIFLFNKIHELFDSMSQSRTMYDVSKSKLSLYPYTNAKWEKGVKL